MVIREMELKRSLMEESSSRVDQFPGFQTYSHRDEFEFRIRCVSRLQKQAPCPLQVIKRNAISSSSSSSSNPQKSSSGSSSSSSSSDSMFSSRDPIPLLSPLVLLVQPPCIREDNSAKSQ